MNKLLEFQRRITPIKKDSQNPHFKNRYFDINTLLESIRPVLNDLGLIVSQPIVSSDGRSAVKSIIKDSETSEVLLESSFILPDIQDPQKMGGAITYYRRYALQSMLCLEAEDDDGNSSGSTAKSHQMPQVASKPSQSAVDTLKVKLVTLGAMDDISAVNIIKEQSGIIVNTMKDVDDRVATEILKFIK